MSTSLLQSLARELVALLGPIRTAVESPLAFQRLIDELGLVSRDNSELLETLRNAADVATRLEELTSQEATFETIGTVLDASDSVFSLVSRLSAGGGGTATDPEALGRDLVELLVAEWLARRHAVAREVAVLLTLVEPAERQLTPPLEISNGDVVRIPEAIDRFHLERLVDLLRDPVGTLRVAYVNDLQTDEDARAVGAKLFPPLVRLLNRLGVSCRYGIPRDDQPLLGDATPFMSHGLIVYVDDELNGATAEAGLMVAISPASRGDLGLVIVPFGSIATTRNAGSWTVDLQLTAGVDTMAYGRHGFTLLATPATTDVIGSAEATLVTFGDGPAYVLGAPDGVRLEVGGARLAMEAALSEARQRLAFSADLSPAAFVVAPSDADGFLASFLPAEGIRTTFELGMTWASDKGFSFRGHAGLDATIPVGLSVAGLTLSSVHLGLKAQDGLLVAEVSASLGASIGPVRALVDRFGLQAVTTLLDGGGNVGVANLDIGIKPPSGVGLSIDGDGVVTGGGFLFHDPANHLYAGVMELSLQDRLTVKAVGLIETRTPEGGKGYSLAIFITAEDFKPIPLGMGFMLHGIGGMLAINRTFDEIAMREALKTGALANLLFPKDPIRNASEIVRNLAKTFPAKRGNYLYGPMAKISWPTPALVNMDLAVIFEFGARQRLIVLGHVSSILPSAKNDLVRLNIDAMGVIDFDEGTASLDGVLVDSRLAHTFVLTGNMAMRARLSLGPSGGFALAIGGFNPHFAPPLGFPPLDRITINLTSGDNPRFICEAYYAITPNTIQFGGRAQLYAAAFGFSVEGDVGYDVLIHLLPFHFLADFHASIQLKRGSRNVFKVAVAGTLQGPLPLRLSAKATFEILWCDFSIRFDKTLVAGIKPPLPPAIDVLAELIRALAGEQTWSTQRAGGRQHGVSLRKLPPGTALTLDPLGNLIVKQSVVPLNTTRDVDVFGGAPVAGARKFHITATLAGQVQQADSVKDLFAPAQFFEMSDDEKLGSPAFEEMDAGAVFGSDIITFDESQIVAAPLEFESIVIDATGASSRPQGGRYVLTADRLSQQSRLGAAATAPIRVIGVGKFRQPDAPKAVTLEVPRWLIASTTDVNLATPAVVTGPSWIETRAALAALNRADVGGVSRWQVVPAHEAMQ
jgi:Family of unknown function (DUF6603)